MSLEEAIREAVNRAVNKVGLERIKTEEFFGMNQREK